MRVILSLQALDQECLVYPMASTFWASGLSEKNPIKYWTMSDTQPWAVSRCLFATNISSPSALETRSNFNNLRSAILYKHLFNTADRDAERGKFGRGDRGTLTRYAGQVPSGALLLVHQFLGIVLVRDFVHAH